MDNNEILEERRVVNKAQNLARAYHIDDTTAVMVVLAANIQRLTDAVIDMDKPGYYEDEPDVIS